MKITFPKNAFKFTDNKEKLTEAAKKNVHEGLKKAGQSLMKLMPIGTFGGGHYGTYNPRDIHSLPAEARAKVADAKLLYETGAISADEWQAFLDEVVEMYGGVPFPGVEQPPKFDIMKGSENYNVTPEDFEKYEASVYVPHVGQEVELNYPDGTSKKFVVMSQPNPQPKTMTLEQIQRWIAFYTGELKIVNHKNSGKWTQRLTIYHPGDGHAMVKENHFTLQMLKDDDHIFENGLLILIEKMKKELPAPDHPPEGATVGLQCKGHKFTSGFLVQLYRYYKKGTCHDKDYLYDSFKAFRLGDDEIEAQLETAAAEQDFEAADILEQLLPAPTAARLELAKQLDKVLDYVAKHLAKELSAT